MVKVVSNALQDRIHLSGTQHNVKAVWRMQYDWEVLKSMLIMSIGDLMKTRLKYFYVQDQVHVREATNHCQKTLWNVKLDIKVYFEQGAIL